MTISSYKNGEDSRDRRKVEADHQGRYHKGSSSSSMVKGTISSLTSASTNKGVRRSSSSASLKSRSQAKGNSKSSKNSMSSKSRHHDRTRERRSFSSKQVSKQVDKLKVSRDDDPMLWRIKFAASKSAGISGTVDVGVC